MFEQGDLTLTVYVPQVESFEADRLAARAAVQVETRVEGEEKSRTTYGVIWIAARTEVNKEAGLVSLDDIQIPRANFPGHPERTEDYLSIIRSQTETHRTISLARIQASLAIVQAEKKGNAVPLKNDPPRIVYSTTPALLVLVDGQPVLRPVEGQPLQRVVNTRALLLSNGSRYTLPIMDRWVQARSLDGPWAFAPPLPGADAVRRAIAADQSETQGQSQVDLLTEPPDDVKALVEKGALPRIVVSTVPAELIQVRGQPQMSPISGTDLLYVTNAESDVFLDTGTQSYFVPLSGRWYTASKLEGPWKFVDGSKLPADFAKIPPEGAKGSVLATVPNTPQAQEAVIANGIPQTAEVKRDEAKLEARYDGEPQFQRVPDTPLQYAVNSPTPVIRVSATSYYAVQDGVWFASRAPVGPWAVATSVPTVIYTIPTASPIHYVTYVRIYRYTPTVVYVGYTPGYMGTCFSPWGTVVYGTGWYYRPWIGTVWLGYPWTWGFGVNFGWSSWYGWSWGFGWSGYRPWRPWWGPYGYGWGRPPRPPGWWGYRPPVVVVPGRPRPVPYNFNTYNVYAGRPGVVRPVVRPAPRPAVQPYPSTLPASGVQPAQPGRPSTRPSPQPAAPGGPSTRPAPGIQPARPTPQPGGPSTRPAPQPAQPEVRPAPQPVEPRPAPRPGGPSTAVEPPASGAQPRPTPQRGSGRQDIYAGRDGNVYRPSTGGTWQEYNGKDWNTVPPSRGSSTGSPSARPTPGQPSSRPQESPANLSREQKARQVGDQRAQQPPPPQPSAPKSPPPRQPAPSSRPPAPTPRPRS